MTVNINKAISWFESMKGTRYSMNGSRNGSDGTGDCSGMVVTALYKGGASKPAWLYNTDSMAPWLEKNGFKLIATNKEWNMQRGDVIIWGRQGASGGAAGHTAIAVNGRDMIDCAWYGSSSVNAVRIRPESQGPYNMGWRVYRLSGGASTPAPKPSTNTGGASHKVGQKVKVYKHATHYAPPTQNVRIPDFVKGPTYTVQQVQKLPKQISKSSYKYLLKEIQSWVLGQDIYNA